MADELTPEARREVAERWGDTTAYRQSQERTASYGEAEWARIGAENDDLLERLRQAFVAGLPADGPEATGLAEEQRRHVDRWFYDCPREAHAAKAELYVEDQRYAAPFEERATGLAAYVRDAIRANAARPR